MYTGLLHFHSMMRWIFLVLAVVTLFQALNGWLGKKEFSKLTDKLSLFTFISAHIQLLLGLILFFVSPVVGAGLENMGAAMKDAALRMWTVEHPTVMIIGIVLVSLARIKAKKLEDAVAKHKTLAIYLGIGLLAIISRIPWDRL